MCVVAAVSQSHVPVLHHHRAHQTQHVQGCGRHASVLGHREGTWPPLCCWKAPQAQRLMTNVCVCALSCMNGFVLLCVFRFPVLVLVLSNVYCVLLCVCFRFMCVFVYVCSHLNVFSCVHFHVCLYLSSLACSCMCIYCCLFSLFVLLRALSWICVVPLRVFTPVVWCSCLVSRVHVLVVDVC